MTRLRPSEGNGQPNTTNCYHPLKLLDPGPDPVYTKNMKNKAMTKLSPAQAYAAQVKADRRAAAIERQGATVRNDNARINEMFTTETPVKETIKKSVTRELWSDAELDLAIQLYLVAYDRPVEGETNWAEVWPIFTKRFPERGESAFRMVMSQISSLDTYVEWVGLKPSAALTQKLRSADPVRFGAA